MAVTKADTAAVTGSDPEGPGMARFHWILTTAWKGAWMATRKGTVGVAPGSSRAAVVSQVVTETTAQLRLENPAEARGDFIVMFFELERDDLTAAGGLGGRS